MNLRLIVIWLLSILSLVTFAQTGQDLNRIDRNGRKQGHWIKKHPDGNIMYDGYFRDDKPTGEFKRFYENNSLKSVLVFSDNGVVANATLYYPDGNVASKGRYVNQLKEGKWEFFSPSVSNLKISEEEFLHNKRNGASTVFYPDSTVAEKINYRNDVRNGEWVKYYSGGILTMRTTYANGRLNGRFEAFFDNGKPEFTGQYRNDLREGLWIVYKRDGSQRFRTEYIAGVADNKEIEIYQSQFIDSLERNKVKIPDPEKTGQIW
jgi:antitoxin component YwqK of YwqJK toxin-antitoxin module